MEPKFGIAHWIRRPSTWVCIFALVLSVVPISEIDGGFYAEADAATSTVVFFILAPAVAAATAWEASRFRGFTKYGPKVALRIYLNRLFIWALLLPCGYLIAFLSQSGEVSQLASPVVLSILGYSFVAGVSWTLIGSALGFVAKPLFSVGLSAGLGYSWYAVVPSTNPGTLRHITGDFLACCSLDNRIDPKAIVVALCGTLGFALVVVSVAVMFGFSKTYSLTIFPLGLSLLVVSMIVSSTLSEFGLTSRDEAMYRCTSEVCAWPEVPKDSIERNVHAREIFHRIAPSEWKSLAEEPVEWGESSIDRLSFSGQPTLQGVLGEFVDQAGVAELIRTDAKVCNIPARDMGIILSGIDWDPKQPVTISDVTQRIEQTMCKKID